MDERRLELQVGALLVAGVVALVALLWVMGDLAFSREPALTVVLSHTGNVAQGAPVKLGGVDVGAVERIELSPERRDEAGQPLPVTFAVSMDEAVRATLRQDAQVMIATRGPLGEAYLELHPGSPEAPPLAPGAVLRGSDAARLDLILSRMAQLLEGATRMLEKDPDAVGDLVGGISKVSHGLGDVLRDNRKELAGLISEAHLAAREVRQLATTAQAQLAPGGDAARLLDDGAATAQVLRKELPGIARGVGNVTSKLTEEDAERLRAAIRDYAAAGQKLDAIAVRAERMLARIEAGEGTVGGLVKEDQLYRDLRDLIADLRKHPWKLVWKN